MAKVLKTVGMIAGAVALVASGVGVFAAAGTALAASAASVATYAGFAAGVANIGAQLAMGNRPPPARGSITQILISPDAPQPYVMGEGYFAGVLRHDTAYGATLKKVPNPFRWTVCTYSGGGPVESITPYVDQAAIGGWYTGFLATDTQLGACPEGTALVPPYGAAPGWDAASKLSGQAAIGWNFKFDKEGKVFASGLPPFGAYGQWVKAYDPRLDSTFPGGSGAHRVADESTWTWTQNPALHAGTYAFGRYQNGKRTLGCGLAAAAIDWAAVAAWASVCDANGWIIFGVVYEPMPETRWPNLMDIAAAGGGIPIVVGGVLTFHYSAPRTALDTFTEADLAEGPGSVTAMTGRRERLNAIIPKFRDPASNWELVPAGAPVVGSTYETEDGEERVAEWPFNLVKSLDQAAELAAYKIVDGRELQPIVLTFGERVRAYRPGDCVHLDIPNLALSTDAVIVAREFDPARLTTTFTFVGETPAKHDWALGRTGTPPPTPGLKQTAQERDELANAGQKPYGWQLALIRAAAILNPRDGADTPRALLTASDAGASATISVARHDWDYPDGTADLTRALGAITGLAFGTDYYVWFDDADLDDAAPTYFAATDPVDAQNSTDHPDRHFLGKITTPADGASSTQGGVAPGYGYLALADGLQGPPGLDGVAVLLDPPKLGLPVDLAGDVTAYTGASTEMVIRTVAGVDVTADFTVTVETNPAALTASVTGAVVDITAGFGAADPAVTTLGLLATGSGDYAGYEVRAVVQVEKDKGVVLIDFVTAANDTNDLVPDAVVITGGPTVAKTFPTGNVAAYVTFSLAYNSDPAHKNNFDELWVGHHAADTNAAYTWGSDPGGEVWSQLSTNFLSASLNAPALWDHPANKYYTFAVKVVRRVHSSAAASGSIESALAVTSPWLPSSHGAYAPPKRRDTSTPPSPTVATDGTAVDHTLRTDSAADISFEWYLSPTDRLKVDGYQTMVYAAATNAVYTPGTTEAAELRTTILSTHQQALPFYGAAADAYFTFAVRTFRNVDEDLVAEGRVWSPWVKATLAAENPYRPNSLPAFTGNLTGTIQGTSSSFIKTRADYADLALNSDGTLKPDMVPAGAVQNQALIAGAFAEQGTQVFIGPSETNDQIFGPALTTSGPRLTIRFHMVWRLLITNPVLATTYNFDVRGLVQNQSNSLISVTDYRTIGEMWEQASATGTFYTRLRESMVEWTVDGQSAANYKPGVRFIVPAGFQLVLERYRYIKLDDLKKGVQ